MSKRKKRLKPLPSAEELARGASNTAQVRSKWRQPAPGETKLKGKAKAKFKTKIRRRKVK